MYFVIIGGGRVGYYLAKALLDEKHEVVVIEKAANICEAINEELGSISLRGDGCEAATMSEAGVERADMLIAVTGEDEDNLVSCQLAKHKFNVRRTIARIRNPRNATLFKMLGIDVTISSTDVILEHIEKEVPTHALTHLLSIEESNQELVEVKIQAGSLMVGKTVKEISLPPDAKLTLIIREGGGSLVPVPNTQLKAGDRAIVLTATAAEELVRKAIAGA